jgi:THAP4-like, heme-binding beta-barrel domain
MPVPAQVLLDSLIGEWRGSGTVELPTMDPRPFDEVIRFSRRNERSIDYWQRAEDADGELLHSEAGIWVVAGAARLEISVALPASVEISEGEVAGDGSFAAESTTVSRSGHGPELRGLRRRYHVDGDTLDCDVDLASAKFPMTFHLRASLTRVAAQP